MFELGLSGQMFDGRPVEEHVTAAARCGYRCLELRGTHVKPETPETEREKVRGAIRDAGLYVSCLSCFTGNYGLLSDEQCDRAFETFRQYVRLAVFMDAEMVRVWPAWQESAAAPPQVWDRAASWMKRSGQYARQHGRRLVMEMHHGTLCDSADSSLRLLEMIGADNVGRTLDPVNLYQVPADYGEAAIRALGPGLFNVHIKDIVRLEGPDYPYAFPYSYYAKHIGRFTTVVPPQNLASERYYCHRRINAGGIDWAHVLVSLEKPGYRGRLVVESVSETNRQMPAGAALAETCFKDVTELYEILSQE